MSVAAVLLLHLTRGQSLFADEWTFFSYRSQGSVETLFAPNNGSLVAVPLLVYRAVFVWFGPDITVLRVILVLLELLCAALFFVLVRPRVGDWIALGATTLLLFLGSGWLLVTTVGITLYLAVAFGLAALIALERGGRGADVLACVLLVLALASYSAALPFVAGAVVAVAVRPAPMRWRRAWVAAIPLLLYGAWRIWAAHYAQHSSLPFVVDAAIAPGAITKAPGLVGRHSRLAWRRGPASSRSGQPSRSSSMAPGASQQPRSSSLVRWLASCGRGARHWVAAYGSSWPCQSATGPPSRSQLTEFPTPEYCSRERPTSLAISTRT
jgi:hypothetical protein